MIYQVTEAQVCTVDRLFKHLTRYAIFKSINMQTDQKQHWQSNGSKRYFVKIPVEN